MAPPTLDDFPIELLLKIISMTNHFRSPFDFSPNRTLPRLARVFNKIHAVAVKILYSDVYISGGGETPTLWKIRAFSRTVSENIHLASLIRFIHFTSARYMKGETKTLAKAIQLCPNLEGVEVSGWNGYELDELKDVNAMKSRKGMKKIELSRRGTTDIECDYFCYLEEFINMLQGWPSLERVVIQNDTIGWAEFDDTDDEEESGSSASDDPPAGEDELGEETRAERKAMRQVLLATVAPVLHQEYFASVKALPRLSVTPNSCLALTHFDFRCGTLQSHQIVALSRIAPSVAYIHIRGGSCGFDNSESLATALRNWSSSLQTLKMDFYYSEKHDKHKTKDWVLDIGDALSKMEVLAYVRLSSSYIQPEDFKKGWKALERPKKRPREGESHRTAFPSTVWRDIQNLCKKRGIELEETDDCDTEDAEMGGSIHGPRYEMDDPDMYEDESDEIGGGGDSLEDEESEEEDYDGEDDCWEDTEDEGDNPISAYGMTSTDLRKLFRYGIMIPARWSINIAEGDPEM
ncbi:uncharacterized protein STEHIDRAFT_111880 [Stereum hirsutum FP-91666 SS1]|uniref:uncharacterized protein n=1 Tax=Stereum hirsutum (strain FP-91666) TaxID=721885 RepID=UPI00044492EA|nr:uncharacterized protein STEHIDRAFT_111880 [Stereum hirsutum FP-91666 SS1]EIM85270.1 hypothetical protein STEHIDRAFT_111880 [Stereum hirsutum FP-91666 SS1]